MRFFFILGLIFAGNVFARDCNPDEKKKLGVVADIVSCDFVVVEKANRFVVLKNYKTPVKGSAGITLELIDANFKIVKSVSGLGEDIIPIHHGAKAIKSLLEKSKSGAKVRFVFQTFVPPNVGSLHQISISKSDLMEESKDGALASSLDGRVMVSDESISIPISATESRQVNRLK